MNLCVVLHPSIWSNLVITPEADTSLRPHMNKVMKPTFKAGMSLVPVDHDLLAQQIQAAD